MLPITLRRSADSSVDALQQELNRMFNRFWTDSESSSSLGVYPVDIREDAEHIYVEAELPGFKKEQVQVMIENSVLHILAERKPEETTGTNHLVERRFTRVARSFTLPNTVNESAVDARLDHGVLHLTLNKREEAKPRRIDIK